MNSFLEAIPSLIEAVADQRAALEAIEQQRVVYEGTIRDMAEGEHGA